MSVQSLERAFDILELLAVNRNGMALMEISRSIGLNKTTVHRLLATLRSRGYIEQNENDNRYRLGLGFISLSSQYLNRLEIKTEAEPYLRRLSQELGETVFLAILDHNEVVYIDKVERFDGLRRYSIIGQRVPVHCTSLGKSLILDKNDEEISKLLILPMQRFTPGTLTDPQEFLEQMRGFRTKGWTRDNEERDPNVSCAAAPIRDYRKNIIAAISSAWEGKKTEEEIEQTACQIKTTADRISVQLGYLD